MTFSELQSQVSQLEPTLSEEGKMLVALFMSFIEAQQGHKGHKAALKENPDKIVVHPVEYCSDCGKDLSDVVVEKIIRKQVEDIPDFKSIVTEHQIEIKICPDCVKSQKATSCDLQQEYQYGSGVQSLAVYLSTHQFTNNQAERDLRMNKVRAKISGGFSAYIPVEEFMRIKSFIHTAIKKNVHPLQVLKQLFNGDSQYMQLVYPD